MTAGEAGIHLQEARARMETLLAREAVLQKEIGALVATGGDVSAMRTERRKLREALEDETLAIPYLEAASRQEEQAKLEVELQQARATAQDALVGATGALGEFFGLLDVALAQRRIAEGAVATFVEAGNDVRRAAALLSEAGGRPGPCPSSDAEDPLRKFIQVQGNEVGEEAAWFKWLRMASSRLAALEVERTKAGLPAVPDR